MEKAEFVSRRRPEDPAEVARTARERDEVRAKREATTLALSEEFSHLSEEELETRIHSVTRQECELHETKRALNAAQTIVIRARVAKELLATMNDEQKRALLQQLLATSAE